MATPANTPSNVFIEPATRARPLSSAYFTLDGSEWEISTALRDRDGTAEDDGAGEFVLYETADVPGDETQLHLTITTGGELLPVEVSPA